MTAEKPSPVLPNLRFPAFGNMPEWKLKQLSDVLNYEQPGKYVVAATSYQSTGTPVLTANKSFVLGHTAEPDGIYQNVPVIIFDDFTTDAKYVDFPFKVKSSAIKILTPRGEDELRLVYELMSRIRFDPTQHKRYFISQYQYLKIPLPGKSEQQKITDCLGTLDVLIAAENRKLEALRQHKLGLLQQLLPQPSDSQPNLRFPEFRNLAEWQQVPLSRILTFQNGYPFSSSAYDEEKQGLRLIRNRDLRFDDRIVYYDGDPLREFVVKDGDLLVGMDGDFTPCVWQKGIGLLNQRVGRILPRGNHVLRFLGYLLEIHLKVVQEDTARTTVKHLSSRTVEGMIVHVPDPDEQQHIADFLSSLDNLIVAEDRKLEALRQHKKGLMQQLFPAWR